MLQKSVLSVESRDPAARGIEKGANPHCYTHLVTENIFMIKRLLSRTDGLSKTSGSFLTLHALNSQDIFKCDKLFLSGRSLLG